MLLCMIECMFDKANQPTNDEVCELINLLKDMNSDSCLTAEAALVHHFSANCMPIKDLPENKYRRISPKRIMFVKNVIE